MKFTFDAVAISIQERESNKKKYYRVNVDQDGEIVTLECHEDAVSKIEKYKPYHFQGEYTKGEYENRVFSRMMVLDVMPVLDTAGGKK